MAVRDDVQLTNSPSRCPYCHDSLDALMGINACAGCGARHHRECFSEHGACASCGETRRLVPERMASKVPSLAKSLEQLPEGSLELTQSQEGSAAIRWPLIPTDQVGKSYVLALLTMPFILGFYMLYWILRYKNSKTVLTLEGDQLCFERPGSGLDRLTLKATRHEIQRIEMDAGVLLLTIRGRERLLVSSRGIGHILKEAEITALYQVLQSWHSHRTPRPKSKKQDKEKP